MAGIQMSGLASGLDTAAIVAQLMQVERIPRARVERLEHEPCRVHLLDHCLG